MTYEPAGQLRENVVHVDTAVDDMLAKEIGMDSQILQPIIQREPWGFRPLDATVIADLGRK